MISVGLIGCGDVAERGHVPALMHHRKFRIVAICDLVPQRFEAVAKLVGNVPCYADWRRMLEAEKLDAVVIALPPEISTDVAIACLDQNLAVLDEKPLAATLADGQRLARRVRERKQVYQSGFVLRYGDWVRGIGRLTASLGAPLRIKAEVYDERWNPNDTIHFSRIQSFLKNSTALTHEGSHVVDYASLWNASPWTSVSAFAQKTSPTFRGPNIWSAEVELTDLSKLTVKVGWLLPELPQSFVSIEGPAGSLYFNCVTGHGEYQLEAEQRRLAFPPTAPEWQRQYDTFATAIDRGHAEAATVNDALRALEITTAGELSVQQGMRITRADLYRYTASQVVDRGHDSTTRLGNSLSA
ncbi:MAG: Gfo/Idh/MocA family oxidoreductase [Pirellulales bacterium]